MGQEKSLQKMALVSLGFKQSQAINWVNNESKSQQKA
jgi:Holliday junction resolvasome RuvABC DNA-binding subunit